MRSMIHQFVVVSSGLLLFAACTTLPGAAPSSEGASSAPVALSNTITAVKIDAAALDAAAAF